MQEYKINKNEVWVILPAYNEAQVIQSVIKKIKQNGFSNLLLIDDGSTDNTFTFVSKENIYGIKLCINRGVGAVFQTGLLYAKRNNLKYIVFIDSDGQHLPEDISKLIATMDKKQADIVIGSRFLDIESKIPLSRRIYNKLANSLTLIGRMHVTDSQSGFRLLNHRAINNLNLELDGYGVCTEMIWKSKESGLKLVETPIRVLYTKYSMSKGQNAFMGIKTGLNLLKKLIR